MDRSKTLPPLKPELQIAKGSTPSFKGSTPKPNCQKFPFT